jgi:protein-S-isoprenylcysteine O-methyltransferase Ste14
VEPGAFHRAAALALMGLAVPTLAVLLLVTAPYGRHSRAGWGPTLPSRLGWILMESPALIWFGAVYLGGAHRAEAVPLALVALWLAHYLHRALVYPFRLRAGGKRMPAVVASLGFGFNLWNGWLNARWISGLGAYPAAWLGDPRFLLGSALFAAGFLANLDADRRLLALRRPGEEGYRIPRGGLYEWVSCPNYLGEMVEWCGWALATWSLAGLAFAAWTIANLAPRALAHHRWYRERFPDYPPRRRALVPFLL